MSNIIVIDAADNTVVALADLSAGEVIDVPGGTELRIAEPISTPSNEWIE